MAAIAALELLRRASDFYDRRLGAVADDQWSLPSVCDEWTVKDLADHVLGGNRFAVGMLAGLDTPSAFAAAFVDGFDSDPLTAYRASAEAQLDAFGADGALDVIVHHPAGDIAGRQFLGFRLGDLLLHAWDVARSTGGDESLDDVLVTAVWDTYEPMLSVAQDHGRFGQGPSGTVPPEASLALRLLDLTGRRTSS